jgi:hypothetical protein
MNLAKRTLFYYIFNFIFYATIIITGFLALYNLTYYQFKHIYTCDSMDLHSHDKLDKVIVIFEPSNVNSAHAREQILAIAKKSCGARKFGEYCINDLLALAYAESRLNCQKIGDRGMSFGCYQIHLGYHPNISKEQARDLNFAINWTLNRMVSKGYPKYRSASLMAHNGTPNSPRTLSYLSLINSYRRNNQAN